MAAKQQQPTQQSPGGAIETIAGRTESTTQIGHNTRGSTIHIRRNPIQDEVRDSPGPSVTGVPGQSRPIQANPGQVNRGPAPKPPAGERRRRAAKSAFRCGFPTRESVGGALYSCECQTVMGCPAMPLSQLVASGAVVPAQQTDLVGGPLLLARRLPSPHEHP